LCRGDLHFDKETNPPLSSCQGSVEHDTDIAGGTRVPHQVLNTPQLLERLCGADSDIWMWDLARRTLNQVTFPPSGYFFPVWTPDGRRLIFGQPGARLFWQLADGTGATEELASSAGLPSGVTPDGSGVLLSPGGRDLMIAGARHAPHRTTASNAGE
jgi:hypothetical protein